MANYTEKATFIVNDKSSQKLNAIRRALNALNSEARKSKGILNNIGAGSTRGLSKQVSALKRATDAMNRYAAASRRASSSRPSGAVPLIPGINKQIGDINRLISAIERLERRGRMRGPVGGGYAGGGGYRGHGYGRYGIGAPFPQNIRPIAHRVTGYDAVFAAREAVRSGGRAVRDRANEQFTQQVLGLPAKEMNELSSVARSATKGLLSVTETQGLAAGRNLKMAGATAEILPDLTKMQLQMAVGTAAMFGQERADRFVEQSVKITDLMGALDDPTRAVNIMEALGQAQLVGGKDFNFTKALTAMRNVSGAQLAMSVSALRDFMIVAEEQERRAATGLRSMIGVLTGSNVADKNVAMLEDAGLREKGSGVADAELFAADYSKWLDKHVGPAIDKAGIDLSDQTESGVAKSMSKLRNLLVEMGFQPTQMDFLQSHFMKQDERKRAREYAQRIKFDKLQELASRNVVQAGKMVAQQFKDLTANAITPLANTLLAPGLVGIAERLDQLSRGEITASTLRGGVAGVGFAGIMFAANNPLTAAVGVNTAAVWGNTRALKMSASGRYAGLGGGGRRSGGRGAAGGGVYVAGDGRRRSSTTRRVLTGAGGVAAGALTAIDTVQMMKAGETERAAYSLGGAIAGGLIGAFGAGPAGAIIGSAIGGEVASTFKDEIKAFGNKIKEEYTKEDPEAGEGGERRLSRGRTNRIRKAREKARKQVGFNVLAEAEARLGVAGGLPGSIEKDLGAGRKVVKIKDSKGNIRVTIQVPPDEELTTKKETKGFGVPTKSPGRPVYGPTLPHDEELTTKKETKGFGVPTKSPWRLVYGPTLPPDEDLLRDKTTRGFGIPTPRPEDLAPASELLEQINVGSAMLQTGAEETKAAASLVEAGAQNVAGAAGQAQQSSQAIMQALIGGGDSVAAKITSALQTPVNVNHNTAGETKSDQGDLFMMASP